MVGSVYVFSRRSSLFKDVAPPSSFITAVHDDADVSNRIESIRKQALVSRLVGSGNISSMMSSYVDAVHLLTASSRMQSAVGIDRIVPPFNFTTDTLKKLFVKDVLIPYYRTRCPTSHYAYTNYHSLNFFSSSLNSTSSVLLYPNIGSQTTFAGHVSGVYALTGAFSFDFYINPRYKPDQIDGAMTAGTIFHLSSCYALSLVTGSAKDPNGRPIGFRLLLQLSHSADVSPRNALTSVGSYPNDLIFLSDDNSLLYNNWHHVVVRWGTNVVNSGTGSFNVDGKDVGLFVVPSSSVAPSVFALPGNGPAVLAVGNYYEGSNMGAASQAYFFGVNTSIREGLVSLFPIDGPQADLDEPASWKFRHQLNAELHDLSIKRYYMFDTDIVASASRGVATLPDARIAFYVPPFFTQRSPLLQFDGTQGGVLQTPFFAVNGSTTTPFNVALSFGVGGHYINLENFCTDRANGLFPRLFHLTASALDSNIAPQSANSLLYAQSGVPLRNLMILPCDDGAFLPGFEQLSSEAASSIMVDDLGLSDPSMINLDDMLLSSSLLFDKDLQQEGVTQAHAEDFTVSSIGFTPENPQYSAGPAYASYAAAVNAQATGSMFDVNVQQGAPLTVFQRTRDASSNQVVLFNVSNLFYGDRILPGSLSIKDAALSGSGGAVSVTLRDDGFGNLYRADCLTSASTWNSVGNVFYDEGLILIKSPHLFFFGADQFVVNLRGERSVHVLSIDAVAPAMSLNSSSNPSYLPVSASGYVNDSEQEFVYITGINFHDENFNVVMKSQLAQPIVKRTGSRILFRSRIDF